MLIGFETGESNGAGLEYEFPIGTPTLHEDRCNHREGFVAGYHLSAKWGDKVVVVEKDGSGWQALPLSVVRPHAAKARHEAIAARAVKVLMVQANTARAQAGEAREAKRLKDEAAAKFFKEELERRLPAGFKGLVVATLQEDVSDSQSDYFAHKDVGCAVIGYTKSARSLFGNMRKAAATFGPTAHLAEKDPENEHRENYSMGGGMYLKAGTRHGGGWCVRIMPVEWAPSVAEFRGAA